MIWMRSSKRNCLGAKQPQTNFENALVKQHKCKMKLKNSIRTYSPSILESRFCRLALSDLWDRDSIYIFFYIFCCMKYFKAIHKCHRSILSFLSLWNVLLFYIFLNKITSWLLWRISQQLFYKIVLKWSWRNYIIGWFIIKIVLQSLNIGEVVGIQTTWCFT